MQIIDKRVEDLIPYENNPRINDGAVDAVAASISRFGWKVPLVIDKNNVVVTGHTRLKAAKALGLDTVPCILADDLSEEQVRAFRLVDNKTGELAGWDFGALEEELADLTIDLSDFGFEQDDDLQSGGCSRMTSRNHLRIQKQNRATFTSSVSTA